MSKDKEFQDFLKNYEDLQPDDFSSLFILVQKVVKGILNKARPGILLGLVEMGFHRGNFVGGLHIIGTNEVYLNKSALRVMRNETSPNLFKAYIFYLLLHEYIHAIGVIRERATRFYTRDIILRVFDDDHPLSKLVNWGLNAFFPYSFSQRTYQPSELEKYRPEFITIHRSETDLTYI